MSRHPAVHYSIADKENLHPNVGMPTTDDSQKPSRKVYPTVSCFRSGHEEAPDKRDWRARLGGLSEREKNLNAKLARMMRGTGSPIKIDKMATEAMSNNKKYSRGQLENTLRRYLYECSSSRTGDLTLGELVDDLQRTTEELTGSEIVADGYANPEETLARILDCLKELKPVDRPTTSAARADQCIQVDFLQ